MGWPQFWSRIATEVNELGPQVILEDAGFGRGTAGVRSCGTYPDSLQIQRLCA